MSDDSTEPRPVVKGNNHLSPGTTRGAQARHWGPISAVWWTLIIFLIPQFVVSFLVESMLGSVPELEAWAHDNEVVYNTLVYGLAEVMSLGLLLLYLRRRHTSLRELFGEAVRSKHIPQVLGAFILYFTLSALVIALLSTLFPGIDIEQDQTTGFESAISNLELVLTGISLIVLPPLTEEILFRGFLFRGLRSRLPFLGAAFIASALFGLAHGQINVAIDTFTLAMVLSFLVEKTKSLWPAIMLHVLKNGLAFTLVYILRI